MLERKMYRRIEEFYGAEEFNKKNAKALMITGARQVGKSYIIEEFGKNNFKHFLKIDFIESPEYISVFENAEDVRDILLRLTAIFGDEMVQGETLIFFDEVQECRELITKIKYLVQEGSYRYILSGSLLGTVFQDILSMPVGYMTVYRMYPLDFEEFAIANGVGEKVIDVIRESYNEKSPVDDFLHRRFKELFELYMIVGGMPAAVAKFLETKNLRAVNLEQTSILEMYKADISKYDRNEKLYLNEIFDLIPSELNSKNKRFILKNLNEYTKFSKYDNSFIWLKNAGMALPAYLASEPKPPLLLFKASNLFKLFLNDVGLLAAQYGGEMQLKILNKEDNMNFGAVYENFAAQELSAHGFNLYFYNSKKFGETDFLIEEAGEVVPIEIKSGKDYYRHKAIDNISEHKAFDIKRGYVFCNGNVEVDGKLTYYPIYMLMFLEKGEVSEEIMFNSGFEDMNEYVESL